MPFIAHCVDNDGEVNDGEDHGCGNGSNGDSDCGNRDGSGY